MRVLLAVAFSCLCYASPTHAQCDPRDFMLKDIEQVKTNDRLRLAFLNTMTRDQYKEARDKLGTALEIEGFGGNLDFETAKKNAARETRSSSLNLELDSSLDYLSQRLSPVAAKLYTDCVLRSGNVIGLRLWVADRKGTFYTLNSIWVGSEAEPTGKLVGNATIKGAEIIDIPDNWPRASIREIVIKKNANEDAYLSLTVNNAKKTLILLKDPVYKPPVVVERFSPPVGTASGGGAVADRNEVPSCFSAERGSYFVPESAEFYESGRRLRPSETGSIITSKTEGSICWKVWADTSCKECRAEISGGVKVRQVTPQS